MKKLINLNGAVHVLDTDKGIFIPSNQKNVFEAVQNIPFGYREDAFVGKTRKQILERFKIVFDKPNG